MCIYLCACINAETQREKNKNRRKGAFHKTGHTQNGIPVFACFLSIHILFCEFSKKKHIACGIGKIKYRLCGGFRNGGYVVDSLDVSRMLHHINLLCGIKLNCNICNTHFGILEHFAMHVFVYIFKTYCNRNTKKQAASIFIFHCSLCRTSLIM